MASLRPRLTSLASTAATFLIATVIPNIDCAEASFEDASFPVDQCVMEGAEVYALASCESSETIFAALQARCSSQFADWQKWFLAHKDSQAIPYDRKIRLIEDFHDRYRPYVTQRILDARIVAGKECN